MTGHRTAPGSPEPNSRGIARREFVALSVAAGVAATAGAASAAGREIAESTVEVKTPDGVCDAAYIRPESGAHPGVLLWPDAFGLRPSMREMAKRLGGLGYAVLVPNPFYRTGKAPFSDASSFDFKNEAQLAKLKSLIASISAPGNVEKDALALVSFLDAQKEVDTGKKIGTQGYCMGGPLVMRTAAALPARIGAGASFHGGGLVTDKPDSPHLLAPKIRARMYFGIAANVPAEIEVYAGTLHGWCIPDMPMREGTPIYNKAEAERAWSKLVALYQAALG